MSSTKVLSTEELGERLRELRRSQGLSQADLARISEVTQATITKVERGGRNAYPKTIRSLARALGVEVTDLTTEPEDEPSDVVVDFSGGFDALLELTPEELDEYEQEQRVVYERCLADGIPEVGMHRGALAAALAARVADAEGFEEFKAVVEEALRIGEEMKAGEIKT